MNSQAMIRGAAIARPYLICLLGIPKPFDHFLSEMAVRLADALKVCPKQTKGRLILHY